LTPIRKILCPVDFSTSSQLALDYAAGLARRDDASVTALHVLADVVADGYPYIPESIYPDQEVRARADAQLTEFVGEHAPSGVSVDAALGEGPVVDSVLDFADRLPADFIVMGTNGRQGVARLLLGSVTERVLRQSSHPVLSISPHAPKPSSQAAVFRDILCPVDFSPSSLEALRYALALAGDEGRVTLFHAVELVIDPTVGDVVGFDIEAVREHHRADSLEKLRAAVPDAARERTTVEVVVPSSAGAYREVLERAKRGPCDLIVMGIMGRSSADMLFFGSTTNHVVREADCPVLSVRARQDAASL